MEELNLKKLKELEQSKEFNPYLIETKKIDKKSTEKTT